MPAKVLFTPISPCLFVIGVGINVCPKNKSTWFTLSDIRFVFPCSNSHTKCSPTPVKSDSSTCVSFCFWINFIPDLGVVKA